MVKRFLYAVALAFILQLSWGTASAYCMHEMDTTSQHFGHHQHKHADGESESKKSPQKKASVHPDCATCAHGAIFITELASDLSNPLLSNHQAIIASAGQAAPYLGAPERPQWLRAV